MKPSIWKIIGCIMLGVISIYLLGVISFDLLGRILSKIGVSHEFGLLINILLGVTYSIIGGFITAKVIGLSKYSIYVGIIYSVLSLTTGLIPTILMYGLGVLLNSLLITYVVSIVLMIPGSWLGGKIYDKRKSLNQNN